MSTIKVDQVNKLIYESKNFKEFKNYIEKRIDYLPSFVYQSGRGIIEREKNANKK